MASQHPLELLVTSSQLSTIFTSTMVPSSLPLYREEEEEEEEEEKGEDEEEEGGEEE